MSTPAYLDPRLGEVLSCWNTAPGGRAGTVALNGRNFFADGDGVTVLMRVAGDDALASDGGVTATRLADAGVDVWGATRAATAWSELLKGFGLREVDGRIVGRRPIKQAEQLASDIASAMLTADGLRYLASPERESQLIRQLYSFLDTARLPYSRRPTVRLRLGSQVHPTVKVMAPARDVLVQAVGGGSQAGIDHALSLVQRLDKADFEFNQRLVLLRGAPSDWPADTLDILADHTPIGFSANMPDVNKFLVKNDALPHPIALDE